VLFATEALLNEHGKTISGQRFAIQVKEVTMFSQRDYFGVRVLILSLRFRALEMWVLGQRS